MPVNACDCHAHIFGLLEQYPCVEQSTYTPSYAPFEKYQHMLNTLGLERAVIVQPSVYGTDNRATLGSVEQAGQNFRAIVVVNDDISREEIKAYHDKGARGVRVNLLFKSNASLSNLKKLAHVIAGFDWHMQLLIDASQFEDLAETFKSLPVQTVFDHMDHMDHMPAWKGIDHPGFQQMLRLIGIGKSWAKLSGSYRFTSEKETPYRDVTPFAQKNGIQQREISSEEIIKRCLKALNSEGLLILKEGTAEQASDIDVVFTSGYGFPRHKGGPMHIASTS